MASSSAGGVRTTGDFYQNVPEINGPGNDTAPGGIAVINPKPNGSKVAKLFHDSA